MINKTYELDKDLRNGFNSKNFEFEIKEIKIISKFFISLIMSLLIIGGCLLGTAGSFDWLIGKSYVLIYSLMVSIIGVILIIINPDLVKERLSARIKAKVWDQIIVPFMAFVGPIFILLVSGLDYRFGWTSIIDFETQLFFLLIVVLGQLLGYWALLTNSFFSSYVRIQKERNHTVVSTGPYCFVRHPGYTSMVIITVATPIAFNSLYALIPAGLTIVLTVIRTMLEDKTLILELEGYQTYTKKVRYKLIPYIW